MTYRLKANQDIDKVVKATESALKQLQEDPKYIDALFPGSAVNGIQDFKNMDIMIFRVTLCTNPARRWEIERRYRYLIKKEFEKRNLIFA